MSLLLYLCVYCDHVLIYNSIGIWGLSINLITYLLAGNFFFFFSPTFIYIGQLFVSLEWKTRKRSRCKTVNISIKRTVLNDIPL